MSARLSTEVPGRVVRPGCGFCRTPSTTFCYSRGLLNFLATTCQTMVDVFCRSLRVELSSWAYPAININSCLQALTKDICTRADIAPSALETIIFYCVMGYISPLTYLLLLLSLVIDKFYTQSHRQKVSTLNVFAFRDCLGVASRCHTTMKYYCL